MEKEFKTCKTCNQEKLITEFPLSSARNRINFCKKCVSVKQKETSHRREPHIDLFIGDTGWYKAYFG